jgi:hypothetical protein
MEIGAALIAASLNRHKPTVDVVPLLAESGLE